MIVVNRDDEVRRDLALNADVEASSVRSVKTGINTDGEDAGLKDIVGKSAEGSPEKVALGVSDGGAGLVGEFLRRQSAELLNVVDCHDCIRGDGSVTRSNDVVEMVHTELRGQGRKLLRWVRWRRWRETSVRLCGKLGIRLCLGKAQAEERRRRRGYAVEEPRIGERLSDADIRAAEFRNVAGDAEAEVVIEVSEAAARDSLRVDLPCKADSWGNLLCLMEPRVIIPPQTQIQRELRENLPVVLQEQPIVIVANVNFVGLRRKAAFRQQKEEAGIDRAELSEIIDGGE